jgi:hypothetical protein
MAQGDASGVAIAKACEQPQQAFSESLLAASKTAPEVGDTNDGNTTTVRRQKMTSKDTDSTGAIDSNQTTVSQTYSQQVVQPVQVVPVQQTQKTNPDADSLQLSHDVSVATIDAQPTISVQPTNVLPSIALPDTSLNELPNKAGILAANVDSNTALNPVQSEAGNTVQDSSQTAVLDALRDSARAPVLQAAFSASTKTGLDSAVHSAAVDQTISSATASGQTVPATDSNASTNTTNQFVSLNSMGDGLAKAARVGASNISQVSAAKQSTAFATNDKTECKDATSDATGLKQHAKITADQTESQLPIASVDQSQSGTSSQGQDAVPVQVNFANHQPAAIIQTQSTGIASAESRVSVPADITSSASKLSNNIVSDSTALPQTTSVINTAKLIQTMGQSEMRVGMRSNEFGNISISTTSTNDVITTQISLDHGELAKTLTAQLPEMQARLGSNQAMEVRIDMNSNNTADTSGNMANGSYDQSRGRQQSAYTASSYAGNSIVESQLSPVVATATTGYGNLNSHLDIRV